MKTLILTINAGSSSLKYAMFEQINHELNHLFSGLIEEIGREHGLWKHDNTQSTHQFNNHQEALMALKSVLETFQKDIKLICHRVVHGGQHFYEPCILDDKTIKAIEDLSHLAPLHNPVNLAGIQSARETFKHAMHVAIFDTGFHHTMPDFVKDYPIDDKTTKQYQIQKYGFHGINHQYVAIQAAKYLNRPLDKCNFISLHLGNGASACLIKNGLSFDTSMGMTPLAGLMMGTRCGDIDPSIIIYLNQMGMDIADIDVLLNKKSGLQGIAGSNDMREVISLASSGDELAKKAIDMYVYRVQSVIGSYMAQINKLDAIIFTAGVGENASLIREKIISPLKHVNLDIDIHENNKRHGSIKNIATHHSLCDILVIPANEEYQMAYEASGKFLNRRP